MVAVDVTSREDEPAGALGRTDAGAAASPRDRQLRLGIAGKIALLMISFGLITAAVVSLFLYHAALGFLVGRQQQDQTDALRYGGNRIVSQIEAARRDALFLLQTPAMQGFVRASTNGAVDPLDDSSLTLTRTRAGELFRALLVARPAYLAVHFFDERGYETVQAIRSATGGVAVVPPGDLQSQAAQPYFADAARLGDGATYVSDPELLREQGRLATTRTPVMRVSTPVLNRAGAVLGVVVITIDGQKLLNLIGDVVDPGSRVYVSNERGDYLANPDPAKTFGFDFGKAFRIQDDFPALATLVQGKTATYAETKRYGSSATLFTAAAVPFDSRNPARRFVVAAEEAVSVPYAELLASSLTIGGVALLVLLMGGLTALVLLRIVVEPLRRMRTAAVNLAAGRRGFAIGPLAHRNDEIGDLARSVDAMTQTIAEREDRLTAQAAELSRSNQDLAQFAYVASHDLQEPLRMVASYLELLSRRYKGRLDQEADEFIGFAVDGAARMKRLINDLLGYSRAGSTPLRWQRINVADLLANVSASLGPHLAETGGRIECDALPTVTGDGSQLERVFQNLIDNALKYHSAAPPRIRVSAASTEAGWRFTVADNGIGIDPRFGEQIFEIFKRLHARDRYAGTGIGLAVTKLIVERHGGRIWVEPAAGGGSVFCFTIPEARSDG